MLSEEEIYQLHLAREDIAVNHEDKEEENVEVKKKKFFGGRFKKCKKEGDKREKDHHENIQDSSNLDKDKGEEIEMQESKDFLNTQDGSHGLDIPREQDSSWKKKRPWEHDDDVTRADDNQEILRLDDILRVQETSTPVQDSMNEWESPRSIDSAGTKGIPRLEDILREQDSSLPTQDHSHELDSPRTQESPRTKEIPRLEEIFSASEGEAKENVHDETRADVCGAHRSRSGSLQAPRIAEFFLPSDESDAERQSVTSEEPLVSHYMEKMDFEKENDDEHGEEPLVSHYMEKMDFEKGNEDNVQDQEPLVSYYKEKMDFEVSKNDEEPVLKWSGNCKPVLLPVFTRECVCSPCFTLVCQLCPLQIIAVLEQSCMRFEIISHIFFKGSCHSFLVSPFANIDNYASVSIGPIDLNVNEEFTFKPENQIKLIVLQIHFQSIISNVTNVTNNWQK